MLHHVFVVLLTALVVGHVLRSGVIEALHVIRKTRNQCVGQPWRRKAYLRAICAGTCAVLVAPVAYYTIHFLEAAHAII